MNEVNKDFKIPYYIFEEITEYVQLTAKRHYKCMKQENIKLLLNLAVINNRLVGQQANYLKENLIKNKNDFYLHFLKFLVIYNKILKGDLI